MGVTIGIDSGSRTIKVVVFDPDKRRPLARCIENQGADPAACTRRLYERMLDEAGVDQEAVLCTVATGYARHIVEIAHARVTEITCHARGVRHLRPEARVVVEIGGQDSKMIWLERDGPVRDFRMNDRCAAGTGRFLEMVSERVAVPLEELGAMASQSRRPSAISSMCVVFAESEIIGLMASGARREDIVAGVQTAIASRVGGMAGRLEDGPVIFTGGVALVGGMAEALSAALGVPVEVAPDPQMTGALGAALIAAERLM